MVDISTEIWSSIALHLKPRHLFKLMLVSKRMNKAADTEGYWSRVAVHMLMRNDELLELSRDLFYLVNFEGGYFQGMQAFLLRVRQLWALPTQDPNRLDFVLYASQPLSAIARRYLTNKALTTMKQIAKREYSKGQPEYGYSTRSKMLESEKAMAIFVALMEDEPMPAKHKRIWGHALHELLEALATRVKDPAELYALSDRMEIFD